MLFIFLTFILIRSSVGDQCPLSNYCKCSSDLTVIECLNHQLTNEFLLKLNNELSKRTLVLNLSSNSLTSIKYLSNINSLQILDLSFNKLRYLPSNFISKYPQLISLNLQNNSLKTIPKAFQNYSNINLNLLNNQIHCTCQLKLFKNKNLLKNLRCQNNKLFDENDFCHPSQQSQKIYENNSNAFCQSIQMNTSKGYFYWPRTLINKKIQIKCPFGSAAWLRNSNEHAHAWYTCSSERKWINFDVSQCAFQTNISRTFDYLSLNETDLLLNLVKYISKLNRYDIKLDDLIFLIDLIDDQQDKYKNQDKIMLIYHLTDFILQIKNQFIYSNQYQIAITRLRLIIERLLDFTNQSWLYIGKELTAMTIQSPLSSTLCSIPNRSLLTIICDIDNQRHQSQLATIQFPTHSNQTNQYSLYRIIFYRHSILFPSDKMTNNNSVIYIRPVSNNDLSTIKLTFFDELNQGSVRIWYANQTSWQIKSSICKINEQNNNFISTNCVLFNNNSFSVTYFNDKNIEKNSFLNRKYPQLVIYISSIISSICLFISILFYLYFYKIYHVSRRVLHCLINYWFNLGVLLPLFAFGIQQNQYTFLCQFISVYLYYLCLTTILWLTLLTYSIWRRLYALSADKDSCEKSSQYDDNKESKPKAVLQFYLLAYGISLIICGINVALSHEQYITHNMCFLNNLDSILILIIFMLIFIFLLLIILLSARNHIKTLTNKPDESENILLTNINSRSLNISDQQESISQLLSILSQLILLIFLFLSSLSIYFHPLQLPFQDIIYSHLYGFFVLFITFYILSFYVSSPYYFNRKSNQSCIQPPSSTINLVINKEYDIPIVVEDSPPSHSHYASMICVYEVPPNAEKTSINDNASLKRLKNVTSGFYSCQSDMPKSNEIMPVSSLDISSQETIDTQQSRYNSFYERLSKRSINIPIVSHKTQLENTQLHSASLTSSRSLHHSRSSPCQAIIRPLPIIRFSSQNPTKNLSNSVDIIPSNNHTNPLIKLNNIDIDTRNSCSVISSASNKQDHLTNRTEQKLSTSNNPPYRYTQVVYIDDDDDDDERSVSLKSSSFNSETSSSTVSTRKGRSRTLSSSSSSSSDSSIDFDNAIVLTNKIKLYESTV